MLHVALSNVDSQSHPSEKTWFPNCSFTSTHRLVFQVPSPVLRPPWPLALQKDQTHLISKPLSLFLDCVYSWAGKLQNSYLDLYENVFYATQWVSIHTGISARTAPSVATCLGFNIITDRIYAPTQSISTELPLITPWVVPRQELESTLNSLNSSFTC